VAVLALADVKHMIQAGAGVEGAHAILNVPKCRHHGDRDVPRLR
jgi:hypothetical protein